MAGDAAAPQRLVCPPPGGKAGRREEEEAEPGQPCFPRVPSGRRPPPRGENGVTRAQRLGGWTRLGERVAIRVLLVRKKGPGCTPGGVGTVQLTGEKGLHLCAAVFNQRYVTCIFANTHSCSREMKTPKPRDSACRRSTWPLSHPFTIMWLKFNRNFPNLRPPWGAFLCPAPVTPTPGYPNSRSPRQAEPRCPPSAERPPRHEQRPPGQSLGLSSRSSGLDAVPEINHISLKSCSSPLFLLANTPGSSLESWVTGPGCRAQLCIKSPSAGGLCDAQAASFRWRVSKIPSRRAGLGGRFQSPVCGRSGNVYSHGSGLGEMPCSHELTWGGAKMTERRFLLCVLQYRAILPQVNSNHIINWVQLNNYYGYFNQNMMHRRVPIT